MDSAILVRLQNIDRSSKQLEIATYCLKSIYLLCYIVENIVSGKQYTLKNGFYEGRVGDVGCIKWQISKQMAFKIFCK